MHGLLPAPTKVRCRNKSRKLSKYAAVVRPLRVFCAEKSGEFSQKGIPTAVHTWYNQDEFEKLEKGRGYYAFVTAAGHLSGIHQFGPARRLAGRGLAQYVQPTRRR